MKPDSCRELVDEQSLPQELIDLLQAVAEVPDAYRAGVEPILDRMVASTRRRRKILRLVQDSLNQLRLDTKYLMFDLEATRRERDAYRQQLE